MTAADLLALLPSSAEVAELSERPVCGNCPNNADGDDGLCETCRDKPLYEEREP